MKDSIKKARERGLTDDEILKEMEKQNPQKSAFFKEARERGASSTEILEEIIRQNEEKEDYLQGQASQKESPKINKESKEDPPKIPEKNLPSRPTEESKLWTRILAILALSAVLAFSLTLFYRSLLIPELRPIHPEIIVEEIHIPQAHSPLVNIYPRDDGIERFAFSSEEDHFLHLEDLLTEERDEELVRVIVEDHREGDSSILTMQDFFELLEVDHPDRLFDLVSNDFDLYIFPSIGVNDIIMVTNFEEDDEESVRWNVMRPWEGEIEEDFEFLLAFLGEDLERTPEELNVTESGTVSIRYREAEDEKGIYYTIDDERLFFSTSLEAMEAIIDRNY